jgi:hypothetical protein
MDLKFLSSKKGWKPARGSDPELLDFVFNGQWTLVQSQKNRNTYKVDSERGTFFVKNFYSGNIASFFKDLFRRPKHKRAYFFSKTLYNSRIPTPRPLGLYVLRIGFRFQALLVLEWIPQIENLAHYFSKHYDKSTNRDYSRVALRQLATLMGQLHLKGLYHGDLVGNVIISRDGSTLKTYLIDLEDLSSLSERRRVKNLEALGRYLKDLNIITLRERWEFLRVYGETTKLSLNRCRQLWRLGRQAQLQRIARRARA